MSRTSREIEHALTAVTLARCYFHLDGAEARTVDPRLWRLLKKGNPILRAEMAQQLAPVPNGPPITLRALACDPDPEVALPVLRQSAAISDAALAEIARCKSEEHLNALAARVYLHKRVAAVVARRAGPRALLTLSRNPTADISQLRVDRMLRRVRDRISKRSEGPEYPSCAPPYLH